MGITPAPLSQHPILKVVLGTLFFSALLSYHHLGISALHHNVIQIIYVIVVHFFTCFIFIFLTITAKMKQNHECKCRYFTPG